MKTRTRLAAGFALALAACAHDPYEDAHKADSAEAYQQFLKDHPGDPGTEQARARLAQLRFQEARQAHTVLAYKRFLEDFPDSDEAPDAAKLLEGLRFAAAQQVNTAAAYQDFLRDHPDGPHATQARTRVEELAWKEANAAHTAQALRDFAARFPDSSHRGEAEQLADDRSYEEAKGRGNAGITDYLDHSPEGAHRDDARAMLYGQEAEALAESGDMTSAVQLAERVPGSGGEALRLKLARMELDDVAAALDPAALKKLAAARPVIAADANALAKELERDGKTAKALRAQVEKLDPNAFGRPVDELIRALDAPDPRDRWLAAEELGGLGAREAFDKLLDVAADSRFEELRLRAFSALQTLSAVTGPQGSAVQARRRLEKLRKMASGPRMFLKVALVEELAGLRTEALADYNRCLRGDGEDLLALRRLLELEPPGFSRAVAARRLAVTVEELARAHNADAGDPVLLAARWFCGANHEALAAQQSLEALPASVAQDAPEDLPVFRDKARSAVAATHARLADLEDQARAEKPGFATCESDDVAPRLEDGVKARLAAVAALGAAKSSLAQYPLRHAARRDPAPAVRAAAQKALEALAPLARGGK